MKLLPVVVVKCIKVKVFYGQEPPSGKSTTTGCGIILSTTCSNAAEVAKWGVPSCSQPQPATDSVRAS